MFTPINFDQLLERYVHAVASQCVDLLDPEGQAKLIDLYKRIGPHQPSQAPKTARFIPYTKPSNYYYSLLVKPYITKRDN